MTKTLHVDASNTDQARAWDGDEGAYWAAHADEFDLCLRAYHAHFLAAAKIGRDDDVLDIGCGTGQTTRDAGRRAPNGSALGLDLSAEMLRIARQKTASEGLGNVRYEQADAQVCALPPGGFDVAISRTGTMFFADPVAAFRNIARAMRPGGRFTQLVWQSIAYNEWVLELTTAMAAGRTLPTPPAGTAGPFAFADSDRLVNVLAQAEFSRPTIEAIRAPVYFGADANQAYEFVLGLLNWMLEGADENQRDRARRDLRATIEAHHTADGVVYPSASWLVTAKI